jgi:thiosulfate dehydrogenase
MKLKAGFLFSGLMAFCILLIQCSSSTTNTNQQTDTPVFKTVDTTQFPTGTFGEMVTYGYKLVTNTVYYIGPTGMAGSYTGNKMNCTNCHQDAGTKPFSFNLMMSHERYPQYRPREGKVLTLADRVNNCIERPHNGKPLPLGSKEMTAILSYLKWISDSAVKSKSIKEYESMELQFPDRAADPEKGNLVYIQNCLRCHGVNGEGVMLADNSGYQYPPLWGLNGYQSGSSMHRVIKQARWLKANMPNDLAKWYKPVLTDEQCFDVAAFVNDDKIHKRPDPKSFDYPNIADKNIDYDHGPFIDTFSEAQHKYGPYKPILAYWKEKGWKPNY